MIKGLVQMLVENLGIGIMIIIVFKCHENFPIEMKDSQDMKLHCSKCVKQTFPGIYHCPKCCTVIRTDELHCCNCSRKNEGQNIWDSKTDIHNQYCHHTYPKNKEHCSRCYLSFDKDEIHCCVCKKVWKR